MKNANSLFISIAIALFISSYPAQAEDMTLEEAQQEIARLEDENQSLNDRLSQIKQEIADYEEKINQHEIQEVEKSNLSE